MTTNTVSELKHQSVSVNTLNNLLAVDLHKFCPKPLFEISFAIESGSNDFNDCLNSLVETNKSYKNLTNVTFISLEDVTNLVQNSLNDNPILLPNDVLIPLELLCSKAEEYLTNDESIPTDLLAQLTKIKIIEVMYGQYADEVLKMQRRNKLKEELDLLSKCSVLKSKSAKSIKSNKGSKKGKSEGAAKAKKAEEATPPVGVDYTTIPLEENPITADTSIYNYMNFYVLTGFYNADIFEQLIKVNVPLTAVIKIKPPEFDTSPAQPRLSNESVLLKSSDELMLIQIFWKQIYAYFNGYKRQDCLENMILMKFCPKSSHIVISETSLLQDFVFLLRSIPEIKLNHLNYVRNLFIYKPTYGYKKIPLPCLELYNQKLEDYPPECLSVALQFDSLLSEIEERLDEKPFGEVPKKTVRSNNVPKATLSFVHESEICLNPFSLDEFLKYKQQSSFQKKIEIPFQSFQAPEQDELMLTRKFYKKLGTTIYDTSVNMLKVCNQTLTHLENYESKTVEVPHRHGKSPSVKPETKDQEIVTHFLHLLLFYSVNHDHSQPSVGDKSDLDNILVTYDQFKFRKSSIPIVFYTQNEAEAQVVNQMPGQNLYDSPVLHYFWRQPLSREALLQELHKAHGDYLYADEVFCADTDTLLVKFHDNLDEFGIRVEIFGQSLRTPVCLRDFAKYITVQNSQWLRDNQQIVDGIVEDFDLEICEGLKKISVNPFYQEYNYLLDMDCTTSVSVGEEAEIRAEKLSQTILELTNYPTSENIASQCQVSVRKNNSFLAYDFPPRYLQIVGAKIIFHSHDDVKVTVDSCRFINEPPQCSVKVNYRNNVLVVHSNEKFTREPLIFHYNLQDGTMITFSHKRDDKRTFQKSQLPKMENLGVMDFVKAEEYENTVVEEIVKEPEIQVVSVDENYFKEKVVPNFPIVTKEDEDSEEPPPNSVTPILEDNDGLLVALAKAVDKNCPLYKITRGCSYLEKSKPKAMVPVSNILNRLLFKTIQRRKKCNLFRKQFTSKNAPAYDTLYKHAIDFRICFPNGLYIRPFPSQDHKNLYEVKQTYLTKGPQCKPIHFEDYRILTREGNIFIKKCDGCVTILKSNGEQIDYEKPTFDSTNVDAINRPCVCTNFNSFRKRLNRIFHNQGGVISPNLISRRNQFKTKKTYLPAVHLKVLESFKLPYLKSSLLKFDGKKTTLQFGKLKQKQKYYTIADRDLNPERNFYERSDGFKSTLNEEEQQVQFPDGSRITTNFQVLEELVDGYVFITMSFKLENPYYTTVVYNFDNSMEILLNNDVVLKNKAQDIFSLNLDGDVEIVVAKELINFEKTCSTCESKFICTMNTDYFYEQVWEPSMHFLHVSDSYGKEFHSNYVGKCSRNSNYSSGSRNLVNCNHYKRMNYKKLFAVKKNGTGDFFLTDSMVRLKQKRHLEQENAIVLSENNRKCKIPVMELKKHFYQNFFTRYVNMKLLKNPLTLEKVKEPEKELLYVTTSVMYEMLSKDEIEQILSSIVCGTKTESNKILNKLDFIWENFDNIFATDPAIKRSTIVPPVIPKCTCVTAKIDMKEKVKIWRQECDKYRNLIRNKEIPLYFESEYYAYSINKEIL